LPGVQRLRGMLSRGLLLETISLTKIGSGWPMASESHSYYLIVFLRAGHSRLARRCGPPKQKVFAAVPCKRLRYSHWRLKHLLVLCKAEHAIEQAPFHRLRLSMARRDYVAPARGLPAVFAASPRFGVLWHMYG
jgi:hypothetical protein